MIDAKERYKKAKIKKIKEVLIKLFKVMLVPLCFGLLLYILATTATTNFELIIYKGMFYVILVPMTIQLLLFFVTRVIYTAPKETVRVSINKGGYLNFHEPRRDYSYVVTRDRLIEAIYNKELDNPKLKDIKMELDNLINDKNGFYEKFEFKTLKHEILVKLKNNRLKPSDYSYLITIIEDLSGMEA